MTATVTDAGGRFVLRPAPATTSSVYEDDVRQTVTHFSAERVPVSLGIVLDTSGSMAGEKMRAAQGALDRFLGELLDPGDEVFLYRFTAIRVLLQDWTTDRATSRRALGAHRAERRHGDVRRRCPRPCHWRRRAAISKKALVVISDGNDTSSRHDVREVAAVVRESEVLVYAIGIDGDARSGRVVALARNSPASPPIPPLPLPAATVAGLPGDLFDSPRSRPGQLGPHESTIA